VLAGCGRGGLSADVDYGGTALGLDSLLQVVNERALSISSVKGSGDLVVRNPGLGRPRRLQVSLIAERPDRARIRGRAGTLVSVFDLAADGDSLKLYLPRDHAVIIEPLKGGGALPVVASRELVPALLQETLRRESVADSGFRRTAGGYEIVQRDTDDGAETIRRLVFEPEGLRLVHQSIERIQNGRSRVALVQYLKHKWTGTGWFPMNLRLSLPQTREELELKFVSFTPNATIDPDLFVLKVPRNTRRLTADDLDDDFLGEVPESQTP
jgi:hypothetical protein